MTSVMLYLLHMCLASVVFDKCGVVLTAHVLEVHDELAQHEESVGDVEQHDYQQHQLTVQSGVPASTQSKTRTSHVKCAVIAVVLLLLLLF